jgi:hypothetical protein
VYLGLATAAVADMYTWTGGGGADTNWSNAANWGGKGPAGDPIIELTFPPLTGPYASHNDLNDLHVRSLNVSTQVADGQYAFTGNPIVILGPAILSSPGTGDPNLSWKVPLTLGANVTMATSGRQTQVGVINLGASTLTFNAGGDILLTDTVSGTGNLVKNNVSALTVNGTNTYTGTTTGNNGALYISNAAALGTAAAGTTINNGFLGFTRSSTYTLDEPVAFNGGGIVAYGTPAMAGAVTLAVPIEVNVFELESVLTIAGPVSGAGGLATTGAGLLILSSDATYTDATSVGGTLRLDGTLASTSEVTVEPDGTLQGNGATAGPIVVESGGTLSPGASPGSLASAGLTFESDATFVVELNGPVAGTGYDQITVTGPVALNNATLTVSLGFTPDNGQAFTIIAQQGDDAVSGTFNALPEGSTFLINGTEFGITYVGGDGHDVVLIAAPGSVTPLPTRTATPSPTATGGPNACTGDCNDDGMVGINELIRGVNIALENTPATDCPAFDANGDSQVTITELIQGVGHALDGC